MTIIPGNVVHQYFFHMILTQSLLYSVISKAKLSSRLRMNYNLHKSFEDKVQRMFNALEPGTVVPIARHPNSNETLIMLRGRLRVLIYDDDKNIIEEVIIAPNSENFGYHIPQGTWHKVESLEPGTILFETREGPYTPVAEEDIMKD